MIVKVLSEWSGTHDGHRFRLVMRDGKSDVVRARDWTRDTARRARNLLELVYGLKRSLIRFRHR